MVLDHRRLRVQTGCHQTHGPQVPSWVCKGVFRLYLFHLVTEPLYYWRSKELGTTQAGSDCLRYQSIGQRSRSILDSVIYKPLNESSLQSITPYIRAFHGQVCIQWHHWLGINGNRPPFSTFHCTRTFIEQAKQVLHTTWGPFLKVPW